MRVVLFIVLLSTRYTPIASILVCYTLAYFRRKCLISSIFRQPLIKCILITDFRKVQIERSVEETMLKSVFVE